MMFDPITPSPESRGELRRASRSAEAEIAEMQHEIERLLLITEALWEIVREKCGCGEKELVQRLTALDLQDGQYDLRKRPAPPRPCPKCGRTLAKRKAKCLFCGEPIEFQPFER